MNEKDNPISQSYEEKSLAQSLVGKILLAFTLLSAFSGIINSDGKYVTLLANSGFVAATVLYARRFLTVDSRKLVNKVCIAVSVLTGVVSLIRSVIGKNFQFFGGPIFDAIIGTIVMVLLIIVCNSKIQKLEELDNKQYIIVLVLCYLLLPSVAMLISGTISAVIQIIICVILCTNILKGGLEMHMDMVKNPPPRTVYRDMEGGTHDTALAAEHKNEQIIENKMKD